MLASKAVTQIKSDQDQGRTGAPVRLKCIPIFKVSLLNAEGNYKRVLTVWCYGEPIKTLQIRQITAVRLKTCYCNFGFHVFTSTEGFCAPVSVEEIAVGLKTPFQN